MKNRSLFAVPLLSLICLALFVTPVKAAENAPTGSAESVSADEQAELQLLYEESDLVTATKRSTPLRKAPAIATVITADEIRNMGARNLLDVLKMVPGIGISTTEYAANMIEVRGIRTAFNEKILLMIDGHPLNKTSSGSGLYMLADMLPVENIRQVEVVRGPGSALYGSNAFMATINIITRDSDDIDGLETKIGGGSFDTFKGNLVGAVEYGDNLKVSGSADYFRTNGPKLRVESDVLRSTAFSNAPGTVHLDAEQTEGFLKLLYGDFTFRGHYLCVKKGFFIGMGYALTNDTQNYYDTDNYWGELAYSRRITTSLSATLKVSYDHYQQQPYVKSLPDGYNNSFPAGKIGRPLVQDQSINAELQLDWDPFPGNHIIAGVVSESMKQYDVHRIANFNPLTGAYLGSLQKVANWNKNAERQTTSFYLQDEWHLLNQVALTAGVRYDHYSDFGGTVNPRAGLVWNALDNVDLKLLYGQAFRAPSFVEMYNINTVSNTGNPNLKAERIATWEGSVAVRFSRALNLDFNYFYSAIDDLIVRDGSVTPTSFNNAGKAVTQGIEMGLNGAFELLQWKTTYAWQDPRDDVTGKRLADVPSQRATASLNYALTQYLNLHTGLIWTGPRPRDTGDTRKEMPDYTTVDMALTAHDFLKGLEIQVALFNLFDKRYSDPDTSGAAQKIPGDFPREGISVLANLLYKF
ncbi:vitamin B12 transporter BtuB [Geobacter sp. OR-1]|uniref:TonB-dependent receptor plug domain-containing protein n=1 Tax=Geobacter sp. OR-1 TaxID=1266765 RepID=UPI0005444F21|nr:TonB-dependent receptor [Geobacter sp. OR-1]GAM10786.1 vitamin B12 transporter BtuB [Geobacter sp. OR-1]